MKRSVSVVVVAALALSCRETIAPADDGGARDVATDIGPSDACETCGLGRCVDLAVDDANCGACGLDCTGGECSAGICRLVPKSIKADELTDVGCLTYITSAKEIFWTQTKTKDRGVFRVPRNGGTPTAYFVGSVGEGIASDWTVAGAVAFSADAGGATLYRCDATKSSSQCQSRALGPVGTGTRWVALSESKTYALYPNGLFGLSPSDDIVTTDAVGPLAVTAGAVAFVRAPSGGVEVVVGNTTATVSYPVNGPISAMVGHSGDFWAAQGKTILRTMSATLLPYAQGLELAPSYLTADPASKMVLSFAALDGATHAIFREPFGSPSLYSTALPIQCLVAGEDALYWLSAGVPYKGHK